MVRLCSLAFASLVLLTGCSSQPLSAGSSDQAAGAPAATREKPTQLAPPIELKDLKGKTFSLKELKGSVVFLDFWATWCPPCVRSVPEVIRLEADYGPQGVEIISLSLDEDIDVLKRFVADRGIKSRVIAASGSTAPDYYGVRAIPRFVIIDKEGRIAGVWEGFHPTMVDKWRSELDRLIKT